MDIQTAWEYGRSHLTSTSPTPQLDARLLLQHILQVNHSYLVAHREQALTTGQEQQYLALLSRAQNHEPIPYITGRTEFCGLEFAVNPAVLIPRPETEQLVATAVTWARGHQSLHIVDVGTGSGCIAICLAVQLPQATIEAVDISAPALAIARQNGQRYAPQRIQFHQGSLLEPIHAPIDLLIANLPYVTDAEWTMLDDGVKLHEPSIALRGGVDGFDLIRTCLRQAAEKLHAGGMLLFEIGWRQGAQAQAIARDYFPAARIEVTADYAGNDRILAVYTG
jgi:release factor glutamine methyltransferase